MTDPVMRLLERCNSERTRMQQRATANPTWALREQRWATSQGWTDIISDPPIMVRASELEAALGRPAPPAPDPDQPSLFGDE